jgi:hypothetical protein
MPGGFHFWTLLLQARSKIELASMRTHMYDNGNYQVSNLQERKAAAEFPCQFPENLVFHVANSAANGLAKPILTH